MISSLEEIDVANEVHGISAANIDPDSPVRAPDHARQWDVVAAVMIGGVLGAEARYGLGSAVPHSSSGFPWSTVYINVVGCFGLGLLMALLGRLASPHRLARPFIGIGVMGGFTTFSTFTVDSERLIQNHRPGFAAVYVAVTLVTAALAVFAGTISAQLIGQWLHARRFRSRAIRGDADA